MNSVHGIPFKTGTPEYQRARAACVKAGVKYGDLPESTKAKVTGAMAQTRQDSAGAMEAFREIADQLGWEIANLNREIKRLSAAITERLGEQDGKKKQ